MSANDKDVSKGVPATEHLERSISNDAVLKVAEHADLEAIEETTPGRFVWLCACATAIGGMLFGYDTLGNKPISNSDKELITALCAAGALVGAVVAGVTADMYGRRPAIWFAMISVDMIFLGSGSVLAYAFDAAFYKVAHGWRYMVGIGGVPSIILSVLLFWCPESPRQLMFHGRREECERVLRRIYPHATEEHLANNLLSLEYGVNASKDLSEEISWRTSLKNIFTIPANFRATIAACGIMAFQQFCGFNTLMYYSSTLFDIAGFPNPTSRRRILLWTMWGMPVCLVIAAVAFHWIPLDLNTLEPTETNIGWPAYVVLVMMILFVAFYAAGLGCVPWQANEFLPMEVRAMGTTLINISNWGPNIVVSATFLTMMRNMTPSGTFWFYAGLSFLGWVFVYFCFSEAANMTLEEVRVVFQHGFGVRYAEEWRKQRKIQQTAFTGDV
ncbi:hypothetical protein INS49_012084 [Diaporthe citri]|uniref:uncharacterized protein n=1 Tax=Diaporthe citri TaxID=83186 RepID=UPI001C8247BF|nr:uncharacterized protein INS49_012084 [Diaporthe citri]KAG6358566.1 hypothetical protein INS49_012084 [Diaporthe citri]